MSLTQLFLTPGALAAAAALTVPPLVLMYFLKLRRREMDISSTFFWKQAVQDLQVNAPFQRLRWNLLLLLQLVVLLLCAAALGQPLWRQESTEQRSLILLLDRSASMGVVEADGRTRLERARDEARQLIEHLGSDDRAMIITFSDRAQVVTPFTRSRPELLQAMDSVEAGDGPSRLAEAVALAQVHAQTQIVPSRGGDTRISNETPVHLVLLSDGRVEDADQLSAENLTIEMISVGARDDNVGIVSMQASREYERPEVISVVAVVANFGPQPVQVDVELFVAGDHLDVQTIELGAGAAAPESAGADPAAAVRAVSFPAPGAEEMVFSGSGVIEVVVRHSDALAADNRALAVIPPPQGLGVLLVSAGNLPLRWALSKLPVNLTSMTPEAYENAADEELIEGGRSRFDVVVFDNCNTARLPLGGYLFLGGIPQRAGFQRGEDREADLVFDWDDRHVVMRYVVPHDVYMYKWHLLELPPSATTLMQATAGPVLSAVNDQGSRFLVSGFSVLDDSREFPNTNWPFRHHFVIFLDNAVRYMSGRLESGVDSPLRPGDALSIRVPAGTSKLQVNRPDAVTDTVLVGNLASAHYGRTDRVGLYRAAPTEDGSTLYAVNLFNAVEGHVQPSSSLAIAGAAIAGRASASLTNVPLWPQLLMAALGVLLLEWLVYSRRVQL